MFIMVYSPQKLFSVVQMTISRVFFSIFKKFSYGVENEGRQF